MELKPKEFTELCELIYAQSGIVIAEGKESMVAGRLARRLKALQFSEVCEYLAYLKADIDREIVDLLDVISTNVTSFFREAEHFDILGRVLDEQLGAGGNRIRIWCAASSTGEEPYTLAMTVTEAIRRSGRKADAKILATDISTEVLAKAKRGEFSLDRIGPVPKPLRARYLKKSGDGKRVQVAKGLRDMLTFRRLNLSKPPFPMKGRFDAIFCRNVMIYFDTPVRSALVREFRKALRPGGLLVVGKSESLVGLTEGLQRVGPSSYRSLGS